MRFNAYKNVRKRLKKGVCQVISIVLCLILTLSAFAVLAGAAEVKSIKETKYDIAVVFDNSGSMYLEDCKAWCRAKYAMEIFASMLNFSSGDKLTVFPMHPVVTDGSTSAAGASSNPISISSIKDIDKIHNLYTIQPSGTPYSTVNTAYKFLADKNYSKKDNCERWLIILTDGEFNEVQDELIDLDDDLQAKAKKGKVNIQYLGIDGAKKADEKVEINLFSTTSKDTNLKDELTVICNRIFDRVQLPDNFKNDNQLKFDISMNKIVVFAQGKGAKIESLVDSNGNAVEIIQNSGQRTYSELNASGTYIYDDGKVYYYKDAQVDDTLAGQVVTFGKCKKGTYTLNCSGAENIQVFYELDVDIDCHLEDKNNKTVEIKNNEIYEGNYNIYYKLIDGQTGELIDQQSELFGKKGLKLNAALNKINDNGSKQKISDITDGCLIKLEKGQNVAFDIEGTFLDRYSIKDSNIPSEIKIIPKPEQIGMSIVINQKDKEFPLINKDKWEPIYVNVLLDNKPMKKDKFDKTDFDFIIKRVNKHGEYVDQDINKDDLDFYYEIDADNSRLIVYLGKKSADDKNFYNPETGNYRINVEASSTDNKGEEQNGSCDDTFKISLIPSPLVPPLIIFLILLLVLLWYLIHHCIKVYPAKTYLYELNSHRQPLADSRILIRPNKTVSIRSSQGTLITVKAKRSTDFIDRRKTSANIKCTYVSTGQGVTRLRCDGLDPTKEINFVLKNDAVIKCTMNGREYRYILKFNQKLK